MSQICEQSDWMVFRYRFHVILRNNPELGFPVAFSGDVFRIEGRRQLEKYQSVQQPSTLMGQTTASLTNRLAASSPIMSSQRTLGLCKQISFMERQQRKMKLSASIIHVPPCVCIYTHTMILDVSCYYKTDCMLLSSVEIMLKMHIH